MNRPSVKARAQKQAQRRARIAAKQGGTFIAKPLTSAMRILIVLALVALIAVLGVAALLSQNENSKYAAAEEYRSVVIAACEDCGLDATWADCILAAMVVESGANKDVESVLGVRADIMQAAEGAYGWVVKDGWQEHDIAPETTSASVYAGVMEFKQNLELWEDYLGVITPEDTTEIQLVIQGYNFGADGWHAWCKARDIRAYTVALAQEYSDTRMPADAKGTPTHAQKWLNSYEIIHKQ